MFSTRTNATFHFLRLFLVFFGLTECVLFFFWDQALERQNRELRHRELLLLIGVGIGTIACLFMWRIREKRKKNLKNLYDGDSHKKAQTMKRIVSAFLMGVALFALFTLTNVPGCSYDQFWSHGLSYIAHAKGGMRGFYKNLSIASGVFACLIDRYIAFFEWLNKMVADKDK